MCDGSGIRQYINGKRAGDEYSGGWKANKRHGFGTYRSSKKEEYEGMLLPCDDDVVVADDDGGDDEEYTNLCNLCFLLFLFIYSSPSPSFSFLHYTLFVIFLAAIQATGTTVIAAVTASSRF